MSKQEPISERASKSVATAACIPANDYVSLPVVQEQGRSFALKRLFDIVGSASLLIILAPVFLAIAIAIKMKLSNVPFFYGATVVGLHGREFRMWKFSSMIPNAHLVLEKMLAAEEALQQEWSENVKLRNDPRIIPGLGEFLRRTSLNELPQLFNVLIGQMSLVGPRPITKAEEALYLRMGGPDMLARRHAQQPGITGLWQATGRSDISYAERIKLDESYLRAQNFLLDIKILWWTVQKVISRKGAF